MKFKNGGLSLNLPDKHPRLKNMSLFWLFNGFSINKKIFFVIDGGFQCTMEAFHEENYL